MKDNSVNNYQNNQVIDYINNSVNNSKNFNMSYSNNNELSERNEKNISYTNINKKSIPVNIYNNPNIENESNIEYKYSNELLSKSNNKTNQTGNMNQNDIECMDYGISKDSNEYKIRSGNSSEFSRRRSSTQTLKREKFQIFFGLNYSNIQNKLSDNTITTTKYSILSFLPLSLIIQFRRAANIYFLIISILTCLDFSPKKPSSMIGTFVFVLIATMIKEFFEDYNRYKQDKLSNERLIFKLYSNGWQKVKCSSLKSGNIVKIHKEEEFSADCLITKSSNENGYCFIDTKNLDGETNLKEKSAIEEYKSIEDFRTFNGIIRCDKSNEYLHKFEGVINNNYNEEVNINTTNKNIIKNSISKNVTEKNDFNISKLYNKNKIQNQTLFVNVKNMVLKGCTLKNTDYIIGIVVYTGKNTKIMKNSKHPKIKVSKILKIMNVLLYTLFVFTLVICIVLSGLSVKFKIDSGNDREYIFNEHLDTLSQKSNILYFFIRIIIFFVLYSNIIPISLYVALEIIKIFQGILIYYDNDLFDLETAKPSKCRATDLIEELGQVEFIFSDKTGTLTQNSMVLKKCFIGLELYGNTVYESDQSSSICNSSNNFNNNLKKNKSILLNNNNLNLNNNANNNNNNQYSNVNNVSNSNNALNVKELNNDFVKSINNKSIFSCVSKSTFKNKENSKFTINGDKSIYNLLKIGKELIDKNNESLSLYDKSVLEQYYKILDFYTNINVCHSVFPETTDKGIEYQGASPDDIALVKGASQLGFVFESKDFNKLIIKNEIINTTNHYEVVVEMPFDSDRKRMSVIVKDLETNKYILYSKGADVTMNDRIDWELTSFSEKELYKEVMDILCKEGYRCLVFAQKEIKEKDFKRWYSLYSSSQSKGRDVSKFYEEIEIDLRYTGLSAIEDKLQDGVGSTIYSLINCNIRVWVLTGDKQDTAIEVAKSCKLILEDTIIIKLIDPENVEETIINLIKYYGFDSNDLLGSNIIENILTESTIDAAEKNIIKFNDLKYLKERFKNLNSGIESAFIIDGFCLEIVLSSVHLSSAFFYLASACSSVVCCRVSPKQKSRVVKLAKTHGNWITLSIGDGANDVPMIMQAHIGVGIQGKEGTQAVRSSDFSIGQFKFLEKLLLEHGKNGYIKVSKFICYYFYKNILVALTEFYFSFYNGFSGQIFFADYLTTMYNAFFTSWPCLFTFIFEKEHNVYLVRKFPVLYQSGQLNCYFNLKIFWSYILYSIFHSTMCFYIPFYCLKGVINSEGFYYNLWYVSTISFSIVIHVATLKLFVISEFWNIVNIFGGFFAIIFYYFVLFLLSNKTFSLMFQPELIGIPYNFITHSRGVIVLIFTSIICIIPDFIIKQLSDIYWPNPSKYLTIHLKSPELIKIMCEEDINNNFKKENIALKIKNKISEKKKLLINYISDNNLTDINTNKNNVTNNNILSSSIYEGLNVASKVNNCLDEYKEIKKSSILNKKENSKKCNFNIKSDNIKKKANKKFIKSNTKFGHKVRTKTSKVNFDINSISKSNKHITFEKTSFDITKPNIVEDINSFNVNEDFNTDKSNSVLSIKNTINPNYKDVNNLNKINSNNSSYIKSKFSLDNKNEAIKDTIYLNLNKLEDNNEKYKNGKYNNTIDINKNQKAQNSLNSSLNNKIDKQDLVYNNNNDINNNNNKNNDKNNNIYSFFQVDKTLESKTNNKLINDNNDNLDNRNDVNVITSLNNQSLSNNSKDKIRNSIQSNKSNNSKDNNGKILDE